MSKNLFQSQKIGICLSGGGARGFAHLGVLQALVENGIKISHISGSSAGAMAGAFFAAGLKPKEILEITANKKVWEMVNFAPNKFGILGLNKLGNEIKRLIPHNSFEKLEIPLSICVSNIGKGLPQYIESGDLSLAVMASSSVPVMFKPVKINGDLFLDGGLMNNLPIKPLRKSCDFIIAVNVTPFEKRLPVKSMKSIILKSVYISVENQTRQKGKKADWLIEPTGIIRFDGFKLKDSDKLFELGYNYTNQALKDMMETIS